MNRRGRIDVEAGDGQGTPFIITLSLNADKAAKADGDEPTQRRYAHGGPV